MNSETKERLALMGKIIAEEAAKPLPRGFEIGTEPYTLTGAMDRARRFIAPPGVESDRPYLEGVFVRDRIAYASNGRSAIRLPLSGDVPDGLHLYGKGWAEKGTSYPDIEKIVAEAAHKAPPFIVSARLLRAVAEYAAASSMDPQNDDGYPCGAVVFVRLGQWVEIGAAVLASETEGTWVHKAQMAAKTTSAGPLETVVFDSKYVIPALVGVKSGETVSICLAPGRYSPIKLTRMDGEVHVIMPMRTSCLG